MVGSLVILGAVLLVIYRVPVVNDTLFWRVEVIKSQIRERINPRPENLATPMDDAGNATVINLALTLTPGAIPTATNDLGGGATSQPLRPTVQPTSDILAESASLRRSADGSSSTGFRGASIGPSSVRVAQAD